MPIRHKNLALYPKDWKAISLAIRERAGWRCEWPGCEAEQGKPHPITGSIVILTTMHLDHDPGNNDPKNLMAACQKCHNAYDAPMRAAGIKSRKRAACAVGDLFDGRKHGEVPS